MIYLYFNPNKSVKDLGIDWESKEIEPGTICNAVPHPVSELTLTRLEGENFRYFKLPESGLREVHIIDFIEFIINQQEKYEIEHFYIATYSAFILAGFFEKVVKKEIKPNELVFVTKKQEYYLDNSGKLYTQKGNLDTFKANFFPVSIRLSSLLYNFHTDTSIKIEE